MLEGLGYLSERDIDLLTLGKPGFKSYSDYLESELWDTIRRAILHRDECRCLSLRCKSKYSKREPKQVHHLGYSRAVLLGVSTPSLVTLCRSCHEFLEFDCKGNKLSYKEVFGKTLFLVANLRLTTSHTKVQPSNPAVGRWFGERWSSTKHRDTARYIFQEIGPDWTKLILKEVYQGRLPKMLIPWLGIENIIKEMCRLKGKPYFPYESNRKYRKPKYVLTSAQIKELNRLRKI